MPSASAKSRLVSIANDLIADSLELCFLARTSADASTRLALSRLTN
jgi:hypothetical protein